MRDNGLPGVDYVAVADLHPQVADVALRLLREAGVPAYADARAEGALDEIDRLFVERSSAEQARALLQERLPRMRRVSGDPEVEEPVHATAAEPVAPGAVDDQVWAGLVASFRAPPADVTGRTLPDLAPPPAPPAPEPARERFDGRGASDPDVLDALADLEEAPDGRGRHSEGHFEPEPPPPLPRISLVAGLAWAAVLLTPAFFLLALWLEIDVTGWLGLFGLSAFVGGFLVLVSKLGDGPDDWDDGAVV